MRGMIFKIPAADPGMWRSIGCAGDGSLISRGWLWYGHVVFRYGDTWTRRKVDNELISHHVRVSSNREKNAGYQLRSRELNDLTCRSCSVSVTVSDRFICSSTSPIWTLICFNVSAVESLALESKTELAWLMEFSDRFISLLNSGLPTVLFQ